MINFSLEVDKLLQKEGLELYEKFNCIEDLCSRYIEVYGKRPDTYQLNRLTNWYLEIDLKDKATNKAKKNYSFHSHRQSVRRMKKELSFNNTMIDFFNIKYVKALDSTFRATKGEQEIE